LQPEQSLFIDDNPRNVRAAEELGIHSVLFTGPEALRHQLALYGILLERVHLT
jgi:2-haloacid dehalogenase